jgi:beta-N-acetylhexosaminidase
MMPKTIFLTILVILMVLSCSAFIGAESPPKTFPKTFNLIKLFNSGADYLIDYKLENMTLAEQVGQLFLVGFHSQTIDSQIKDLLENYYVGGVIYFTRNIENLEQTQKLSKNLQELALNNGAGIPLFIAVDQEGGKVRRIKDLSYFPANQILGAAGNQERTRKTAAVTARELKGVGVNLNLAPVLDVNNNPNNPVIGERSFGAEPELVAKMGAAYIKGLQSEGIIAAAKHFPGHGDTVTDSHTALPVINHSRARLDAVELYPFKKAIEVGVEVIMAAHIYFPAIETEAGIPATLSKAVLTDLLREELDFRGLIITDDMEMGAITKNFGTVQGAVRSIKAGSDIVLISHSYDLQKEALAAVTTAVKNGEITKKRIKESVKRILKLKVKRLSESI